MSVNKESVVWLMVLDDSATVASETSSGLTVEIPSVVRIERFSVWKLDDSVNATVSENGSKVVERAPLVEESTTWLVCSASSVITVGDSEVNSCRVLAIVKSGDAVEVIVVSLLEGSDVIV